MNRVQTNAAQNRFELAIDGSHETAAAYYRVRRDRIILTHTVVPEKFSGQGVGSRLARGVFDEIRRSSRQAVLVCPFMTSFYERHPEYADMVLVAAVEGEFA